MNVRSLGYLGFESQRLKEWRSYCTDFLGLMDVSDDSGDLRFRADDQNWRIEVKSGPAEDIAFAGFETSDQASLEAVCENLSQLGFEVSADLELAEKRSVSILYRTLDPDGLQIELYAGASCSPERPFVSPVGVSKFVTTDLGIGHFVLSTGNAQKKLEFYQRGLGFRVSDTMSLGPTGLTFLHCNPRHHTLAIAEMPSEKKLAHFMLQVETINDVGFAMDRATEQGLTISTTFGCHTNDHMLSFYTRTPSGFDVEFGCGGRLIDENWPVSHYVKPSIWGHRR